MNVAAECPRSFRHLDTLCSNSLPFYFKLGFKKRTLGGWSIRKICCCLIQLRRVHSVSSPTFIKGYQGHIFFTQNPELIAVCEMSTSTLLTREHRTRCDKALPNIRAIMRMSLSLALPYCDTFNWHQIWGPCKISYSLVQNVWHSERSFVRETGFMRTTVRVEHSLVFVSIPRNRNLCCRQVVGSGLVCNYTLA